MEFTGKVLCIKHCNEVPSGKRIYTKGRTYDWIDGDSIKDDLGEPRCWAYLGEVDKEFFKYFRKVDLQCQTLNS